MPPTRDKSKKGKKFEEPDDDNYRQKRDKNNEAVKRSRDKSKMKTKLTLERVTALKVENEKLEEKIKILRKDLQFLKKLFLTHASSSNSADVNQLDLQTILQDDDEEGTISLKDKYENFLNQT